jgi:hypothetical protein
LKLDLHELCALKLDWDDPVPDSYLSKWAATIENIQELKQVTFTRENDVRPAEVDKRRGIHSYLEPD